MAISFSGLATGLDTDAIIRSLVGVQEIPILRLQQENQFNQSKIGVIDKLSSALSTLRSAVQDLDSANEFLSYKGKSSDDKVARVTTSGDALPGTYSLTVDHLATAQRTYSNTVADKTAALSGTDQTFEITIGGETTSIDVTAGSTLEDVVNLINGSGADVRAGLMFDGTQYRLQVAGNETGLANAISFSDSGLGLGMTNTVQSAQDALFYLDGVEISSADNMVDDVIPGTTIELLSETADGEEETISIAADPEGIRGKLDKFVSSYNAVFNIINSQVGQGKGRETLNGDSTVRGLEQTLGRLVSSPIPGLETGDGESMQLADLGIKTNRDGTLTLDGDALDETLASGFQNAARYFAGDASADIDGFGALLSDAIETYTSTTSGLLKARKDGLNTATKNNDARVDSMQRLLEAYEQGLRDQYTKLESAMSALQSQQSYLAQFMQRF